MKPRMNLEGKRVVLRGMVVGGLAIAAGSFIYAPQPFSLQESGLFLGTYVAVLAPFSFFVGNLRRRLLERWTLPEFKVLYSGNKFMFENYTFNKRALLVDVGAKMVLGNLGTFLVLKSIYAPVFGGRWTREELRTASWWSLQAFALTVVNELVAGFRYLETQTPHKFYKVVRLLIHVRLHAQLLALVAQGKSK